MAIKTQLDYKAVERFWAKVDKTHQCWLWIAAKTEKNYGVFGVGKETDKAHRIAWRLTYREIPKGLCVLHRCDNPPCVNPAHLFLGTIQDNNRDMLEKGRNAPPPTIGGWNKKILPKELIEKLGTRQDYLLALEYGISKHTVARRRKQMNIPSFASTSGCNGLFSKGMVHPRWG